MTEHHGIVQDERGQDQPASKAAAHRTDPTVPKDASELDPRDIGPGIHQPVKDEVEPQPDQVPLKTTPHKATQPGADVRPVRKEPRR
jgi:hypothetical protein